MLEEYIKIIIEAASGFGDFRSAEKEGKMYVEGELKAGTKGMTVSMECSPSSVKIKGTREYRYEILENTTEAFQDMMQDKYPDCYCYVSGNSLTFSKYGTFRDGDEASKIVTQTLKKMAEAVSMFERRCVNFENSLDEHEEEEEYNPEDNISLVEVDNSYHAAPATASDNEAYLEDNRDFAEEEFDELCKTIGGTRDGNEITVKRGGCTVNAILYPLDGAIGIQLVSEVSKEVAAMYSTFFRTSYPEMFCDYTDGNFVLEMYSYPDRYAPGETQSYFEACLKAMDACIQEYDQMLKKKDSAEFASDIQEVLSEQTKSVMEREKAVSAREEEVAAREAELEQRLAEVEEWAKNLEEENDAMKKELEEEKARIQEHEAQMQEEMKTYEERNTKDILRIQQLAKQVSTLQDRQATLGQGSGGDEAEMFRLKSRVQQLISQKASLEKALNEKITARDTKIKELKDVASEKEAELRKIEAEIDDIAKSRAAEEAQKTADELDSLHKRLDSIGHILTAAELLKHYKEYDGLNPKKFHAPDGGQFVVYTDESLEVRIRVGSMNYVDVSKKATLKDPVLKKLNSANTDIKFFNKDDKIVARSYFPINASTEEVEDVVDKIADFFTK